MITITLPQILFMDKNEVIRLSQRVLESKTITFVEMACLITLALKAEELELRVVRLSQLLQASIEETEAFSETLSRGVEELEKLVEERCK